MRESTLTHDELTRKLDYNPETGEFRWSKSSKLAGNVSEGRARIRVNYVEYKAHRLAWFYVHGSWPAGEIDHVDQNPLNNAIANLREATRKQNGENQRRPRSNNKLGIQGVCKNGRNRYRATLCHYGKAIFIGNFDTPEEASAAYWRKKEELHEFCPQL